MLWPLGRVVKGNTHDCVVYGETCTDMCEELWDLQMEFRDWCIGLGECTLVGLMQNWREILYICLLGEGSVFSVTFHCFMEILVHHLYYLDCKTSILTKIYAMRDYVFVLLMGEDPVWESSGIIVREEKFNIAKTLKTKMTFPCVKLLPSLVSQFQVWR